MLVNVTYLKDHASHKKGDKLKMPESTAHALAKHGVLSVEKTKEAKEKE